MEKEAYPADTEIIEEKKEQSNGIQVYEPVIIEKNENKNDEAVKSTSLVELVKEYWEIIIVCIWAIGFLGALYYHVFQYYLVKEFYFEEARVSQDEKLIQHFCHLCKKYHMKQIPVLLEKDDAATPMTFGYIHRKLVFPPDTYSKKELSLILRHELTHIKKFDSWYKTFVLIVCDLYWFNPIFLLMKQMAYRDVEYVCDESVTRNMDPEEKKIYGTAILKTVSSKSSKSVPSMVSFAVNKTELKKRLNNLFIFDDWKKGSVPLVISLLIVAALLLGISVSVKEVMVTPSDVISENAGISIEIENEKLEPVKTYYTNDLEALNDQKDIQSSYITEKYCFSNLYYIDDAGTLWGTGRNDNWQLGIKNEKDVNSWDNNYTDPVKIAENVIHVDTSSNGYFVIWLTKDRKLYGMGANAGGALLLDSYTLGTHSSAGKLTEEPTLLMENITFASAGRESISVVNSKNEVWWWGTFAAWTGSGGPGQMQSLAPKLMLKNAKYTVCGNHSAAAIDENNQLWTWGCNVWGQCGIDTAETGDYLKEARIVCDNVEMVWSELLSTRQNSFEQEFIRENENWNLMNQMDIAYTTFIRKTDGNYYACGIDIGINAKSVDYFGGLYIEDSEDASNYLRSYSYEFLPIEVLEKPQEEWIIVSY